VSLDAEHPREPRLRRDSEHTTARLSDRPYEGFVPQRLLAHARASRIQEHPILLRPCAGCHKNDGKQTMHGIDGDIVWLHQECRHHLLLKDWDVRPSETVQASLLRHIAERILNRAGFYACGNDPNTWGSLSWRRIGTTRT
jgi:hypothetical protein